MCNLGIANTDIDDEFHLLVQICRHSERKLTKSHVSYSVVNL